MMEEDFILRRYDLLIVAKFNMDEFNLKLSEKRVLFILRITKGNTWSITLGSVIRKHHWLERNSLFKNALLKSKLLSNSMLIRESEQSRANNI